MKNATSLLFTAAAVMLAGAPVPRAAAQALSVNAAQKARLAALVQKDPEAKAAFAPLLKQADAALADAPDPAVQIFSQGVLATDPRKIRTRQSLKDMGKMNALAWAWAVTGKTDYASKTRTFLLAWAKTNVPNGDPINDTQIEAIFTAYDLVQSGFSPDERKTVDAYLRSVAVAEQGTAKKGKATAMNNWHSHRIKTVGIVGYALHDAALIQWADDAFHQQIEINLLADGASWDFGERDALHYHLYDLEPLLTLAQAARQNNGAADWFHYQSPKGASLAKSVAWTVPYATGEKTHGEFTHSRVAFDKKRADAGEKGYAAGTPFEPRTAHTVFEKASAWEPTYRPLALRLLAPPGKSPAKRFGSWQMVVQEARK